MFVRSETAGGVAALTLDSPHNRNALSGQLVAELTAGLVAAGADDRVRAVVIGHTGAAFCSGGDLAEAGRGGLDEGTKAIMAMLTRIVTLPKPVIAKVNGHVRAGGLGIVGACDIAVAGPKATFAFTEVRIGVAPAIISLTTLDVLDPRAASRYYLTGETFRADVAADLGLVTMAADDADAAVEALVAQVRQTSPQGSRETKALLTAARRDRLAAGAESMVALSARLFASVEAQEGIHAFLERRAPAWIID